MTTSTNNSEKELDKEMKVGKVFLLSNDSFAEVQRIYVKGSGSMYICEGEWF